MSNYPTEQMTVKITVNTTIQNGQEKETYELITFGQYIPKTNSTFLRYEEYIEENKVKTTVKVSGQEGSILRKGSINMRLPFLENQTLTGNYETPFGTLQMETTTQKINHTFDQDKQKGNIDLVYDLSIQGSYAGTYNLQISFEEERA